MALSSTVQLQPDAANDLKFKISDQPNKLAPFADQLSAWLKAEAQKPRKLRRTVKQLHADLLKLGYEGSYCRVAKFARRSKAERQEELRSTRRGPFVPLVFKPGEAFQFDWSEEWAIIEGERTKLQVAHTKLCYSRAFVVRAYLLQTHEMLFDAHNHAFRVFGGIPRRGIYDNMKTAVNRVGRSKVRDVNVRFMAMASHYLFEPVFCNPASGWEKGQIEKSVWDTRLRLWQPLPKFPTLEALNDWLEQRCKELWTQVPHTQSRGSIADVWAEEKQALLPTSRVFDGFVEYTKRVSPTCLIHFERNRYSVPASFANQAVSLRVYPDRLVVASDGVIVCEHHRVIDRSHDGPGHTIYDWRHYLTIVQRKPGALRNGAPFEELPDAFRCLRDRLLKKPGGDRDMVDILALVLQHDEQIVLSAVEMALKAGVPTKTHVLNLLHRLVDDNLPTSPPVRAPQVLTLINEPRANLERYDTLRNTAQVRNAS